MGVISAYLYLEADAVTAKPVIIPFEFDKTESIPKGKSPGENIVVSPITTRTWFKIKPLLLSIDKSDLEKLIEKEGENKTPTAELIELMAKYDELIFEIVCAGIHNKKGDMPVWFREVLKDNSTWEDIHILLNAIFFRLGFNPFCKSITNTKIVSPMTDAEIIAAHENAKSWKKESSR